MQAMPAFSPETSHLHEWRTCTHCCTALNGAFGAQISVVASQKAC